jgi:hypothetical protein
MTRANKSMNRARTTIHHESFTYSNMECLITKRYAQETSSILKYAFPSGNIYQRGESMRFYPLHPCLRSLGRTAPQELLP